MHAMNLHPKEAEPQYREDCEFESFDGCPIYYRYWHDAPGLDGSAVLLLHDHQEHSEYYRSLAAALAADGYRVFAWDARGCGRSPDPGNRRSDFHHLVRDLDAFTDHLRRRWRITPANLAALGQGAGAAVLATWLHDYAPPLAGAVLSAPPFRPRALGRLRRRALALGTRLQPGLEVRSPLRPGEVTDDRGEAALRRDDPFVRPFLPARQLLSQQQAMERVEFRPEALELPVLMLCVERDPLADFDAGRRFFDRLGSLQKTWKGLGRGGHALFHGRERGAATGLVREFLAEALDNRPNRGRVFVGGAFNRETVPSGRGTTRATPLRHLSRGARLAHDTGFHSGHHADYLLRDQPHGRSALERLFDAVYQRRPECRALRERYRQLGELIAAGLADRVREAPVRVLQLGGAPARALCQHLATDARLQAVCIDPDRSSLESGRRLAGVLGLRSVRFARGGFDEPALLADWPWAADLVIADGALERCQDHAQALRLLRAIKSVLRADGALIVGNLLPHPAPPLPGIDGAAAWRARDAAELNRLLRLVGLEPARIEIESLGLYSLTLARSRVHGRRIETLPARRA